jgi:glycosyltransferase involved in cell wall biosynthesis
MVCNPDLPRTPSVTVAEIQGPAAATASNPLCWFHIGDTVEWLSTHRHLTEVGKVTTEILAAVLSDPTAPRWHLSTMRGDNLVRWEPGGAPSGLGPAAALRALLNSSPPAPRDPHFGDHVLFTGVVWTPAYTALIERLRARGVRISVLLYDLIPLERPDLVSAAHVEGFAQWLRCAVVESELIFTSAKSTRVQLYRWAIAAGITPRNPVQVIRFGCSLTRSAEVATDPIVREPFVLCVGTINSRKNQLFLCNAWATLSTERPMPVLVLAGRDDLGLARADRDVATLLDQGRIRILSELDDVALDALYRAALFTVFPSLFEGYGLPVADSLAYGKLCLAADLPVIREHAGDLPWYFDPRQPASLIAQLRRVLDDVPARTAAKVRLAGWRPPSWRQTAQDMTHGILERLGMPHAAARRPIDFPMTLPVSTTEILDRAREWCVEEEPEVSIIVVNRNATEMTCACIQHIWANTTGVKYEILVADNGSDPEALHVLRDQGGGLRLLRLGVNRYFGEANNIAVEAARGRFVCLLNNDAFVTLGWLTNLLAALRATPNAGAVGPVFLFPDGMIQEAGALINTDGVPERLMRGADRGHCAAIDDRSVDCISAACLLLTRDLFLQAGGFDLAYEPAYYEDVDLCCKLAMLGYGVKLVAGVDVVHLEGPSTGEDAIPSIRKRALEELNRKKFLARWHGYLHCPDRAALAAARIALPEADFVPRNATPERRALLYSPHNFTAGGGERYLLTFAAALSDNYQVTIAATHRYSRLRLRQLAAEFGISLAGCDIAPLDELSGEWDVMVALGNHVVPPVAARGHRNFFICQFPFPLPAWDPSDWSLLAGYDKVLAYSDYTRRHIEAAMSQNPSHRPVQVLYPPVPLMSPGPAPKRTMILTVGRFFAGGHNKRHDLLIQAFQTLHAEYGEGVEFHLAGSSMPDPGHMDHLSCLQESTSGLPVFFHVNAAPPKLASLYQDAAIYWHGTGLEADLQASPELAEHFGIAIVESMSAGCVAFALNAGAAPEIITDDVDGCLYDTVEALVERSVALLRNLERRTAIGTCARRRAADFDLAHFTKAVRRMLT